MQRYFKLSKHHLNLTIYSGTNKRHKGKNFTLNNIQMCNIFNVYKFPAKKSLKNDVQKWVKGNTPHPDIILKVEGI
jgi:hypothetical protein